MIISRKKYEAALLAAEDLGYKQAEKDRKGFWNLWHKGDMFYTTCSKCHKQPMAMACTEPDDVYVSDFCPKCGADMRGTKLVKRLSPAVDVFCSVKRKEQQNERT